MTKFILADGTRADHPDSQERKVVWTIGAGLIVATLVFTILHHGFPSVLNVPPRTHFDKKIARGSWLLMDPPAELVKELAPGYSLLHVAPGSFFLGWSPASPSLAAEKQWYIGNAPLPEQAALPAGVKVQEIPAGTVLRVSIPGSDYLTMFILDLIPIGLAWLCFHHGWRRLGMYRAMLFLGGSFVFTGLEESMWILLGRYTEQLRALSGSKELQDALLTEAAADVQGTYYFTKGFFWFLETPVLACLGWFFVAYSCVYVAELLLPRRSLTLRAGLGGLLAMNLDLWLDPVQTSNTFLSWIWAKGDRIEIFSIPLSNFMGWFLLIFLFALVFDRVPAMVRRWGPAKAALYFYSILFALEIGILIFFAVYGTIAMRLLPETINFTIMDIGRHNLTM
jgi:hypothetical protein